MQYVAVVPSAPCSPAFVGTWHAQLLFLQEMGTFAFYSVLMLAVFCSASVDIIRGRLCCGGCNCCTNTVLGGPLFRFLMLDNDTEYFVEPRYVMSGASSWMERDGESSSLWRTRTSLGTAMGGEADWEITPEDIVICKDPYGRDWQLGTGGFGSVRRLSLSLLQVPSLLIIENQLGSPICLYIRVVMSKLCCLHMAHAECSYYALQGCP